MSEIIIRYFHFLGIIVLSTALIIEHLMLSKEVKLAWLVKLLRVDAIYGLSIIIVLATGLLQWFVIGKPTDYYNSNYIFHIKLTLFFVMAILSLFQTRFYIKQRKLMNDVIKIPSSIFIIIRIELFILFLIPLLAVLMAKGLGMS